MNDDIAICPKDHMSRLDRTNAAITSSVRAHGDDGNPVLLAVLMEIARSLAVIADNSKSGGNSFG